MWQMLYWIALDCTGVVNEVASMCLWKTCKNISATHTATQKIWCVNAELLHNKVNITMKKKAKNDVFTVCTGLKIHLTLTAKLCVSIRCHSGKLVYLNCQCVSVWERGSIWHSRRGPQCLMTLYSTVHWYLSPDIMTSELRFAINSSTNDKCGADTWEKKNKKVCSK